MCTSGSQLVHGLRPAICARQCGASLACRHRCNLYISRLNQTPPREGFGTSPAVASASGREAEQRQQRRQSSYHLPLSWTRSWRRSIKAACTADGYADPGPSATPSSGLPLAGGQIGPGLKLACLSAQAKEEQLTLIVPDSIDAVMDMYIDNGMEDRDPYWARPWHSAISMAEEILERPELVKGKTVVDVGAGLGVGGIAAAIAGAARVVLLDREPLALQCALMSAMACGIPSVADPRWLGPVDIPKSHATFIGDLLAKNGASMSRSLQDQSAEQAGQHEPPVVIRPSEYDDDASSQERPLLEAGVLDWLNPVGLESYGKFDVVIACDVLYEDFSVEPVASLVPMLLRSDKPTGQILLADPPNRTRHNRERFLELLKDGNLDVKLLESGRRRVLLEGQTSDVQMLLFQRTFYGAQSTLGIK